MEPFNRKKDAVDFLGSEERILSSGQKGHYDIYRAKSRKEAIEFLKSKVVDKPLHYIIVQTPVGEIGLDVEGIYDQQGKTIGGIKAKVTHPVFITGDSGYMLEIVRGKLPAPDGRLLRPGDSLYCFDLEPQPGDYCAYFMKNVEIGSGSLCDLGAYDIDMVNDYKALPLRIVHLKSKG